MTGEQIEEDEGPQEDMNAHISEMGTIAPVTNHTLDPVTTVWDLSYMAGFGRFGDFGHDSMEGIDKQVTGEVNAMKELEVESWTDGGPLEIADNENFMNLIRPDIDLKYEFDTRSWTDSL